jgi:3-hydroxy-9,10-secoandrosta-1,3,5(10)-triene-9,17-dione monooxygenase reductase component
MHNMSHLAARPLPFEGAGAAGLGSSIDSRQFRNLLGRFPTGVTVITARAGDGQPVGLTVNSFASVSLDPALVLWSLSKRSASLQAIEEAGAFAIHFLGQEHQDMAERFCARTPDRFADLDVTTGPTGSPLLSDCIARIECRTTAVVDGGDHRIFIGAVVSLAESDGEHGPLVFHKGCFTQLQ